MREEKTKEADMNNNNDKEIVRGILSVIVGIIAGNITFLILLFFMTRNHKAGEMDDYNTGPAVNLIAPILGMLVSGFITALISFRKPLIYSAITGIGLIIFCMTFLNVNFSNGDVWEKIDLCLILPFTILGGWLGFRIKTKKKSG